MPIEHQYTLPLIPFGIAITLATCTGIAIGYNLCKKSRKSIPKTPDHGDQDSPEVVLEHIEVDELPERLGEETRYTLQGLGHFLGFCLWSVRVTQTNKEDDQDLLVIAYNKIGRGGRENGKYVVTNRGGTLTPRYLA